MNERIKTLAEQAGWVYVGNSRVPNMEKFAELIVLECACIADDMKTLETARAIKDHFGIDTQS